MDKHNMKFQLHLNCNGDIDGLVPVFEISVGPTVRDREVVCRTDNKLNLPVLLSDNISDRVFTNL